CATFRSLQAANCAPRCMAVNVSMLQFRQADFPERVMDILATHSMPADALELEITESLLLAEPQTVRHNLDILRQAGIRIAVDDFGTGYSSLAYLRQLPIDRLKVDRSFLRELDTRPDDATIVQTIAAMAIAL